MNPFGKLSVNFCLHFLTFETCGELVEPVCNPFGKLFLTFENLRTSFGNVNLSFANLLKPFSIHTSLFAMRSKPFSIFCIEPIGARWRLHIKRSLR